MALLTHPHHAYKLDVGLTPKWDAILEHQFPEVSKKTLEKFIAEGLKKSGKDSLYGTRFHFTEYQDTGSGLSIRSVKQLNPDKSWEQNFVNEDEGEISGFIFDHEKDHKGAPDTRLRVRLSNNGIVAFHEQPILARLGADPLSESILSHIPLSLLKRFFIEVGTGFRGLEMKPVVAWPEKFGSIFARLNISHFKWYDTEPPIFDLAHYDKHLAERLGNPRIGSSGFNPSHRFETPLANYDIEIKLFYPKEHLSTFEDELNNYLGRA